MDAALTGGTGSVACYAASSITSSSDSPLEEDGFEPSVPLLRKALLGVANRRRRHERRSHLQVQVRNGNACLEWPPIAFPSRRDREFESVFLQRRVHKPSVPPAISLSIWG
jgi:hypothetical protein